MNLEEALKLSQELEAKASPGPWAFSAFVQNKRAEYQIADAVFICHARNTHMKYVESCRVMHEALKEIEEDRMQTILGPAFNDDADTFERSHEVGAHKAFINQADKARDALETVEKIWSGE